MSQGQEQIPIYLTQAEINRLADYLKTIAQAKKARARTVHANDKQDMLQGAMADYELRKKIIGQKVDHE